MKQKEIDILLTTKKILNDYLCNFGTNTNAQKLDNYIKNLKDIDSDPLVMFKNNLKSAVNVLDLVLIIKQTKSLNLD